MLARQHQVENDQIDLIRYQVGVHGLAAVDAVNVESLLGEIGLSELANFGVVVDYEKLGAFNVHDKWLRRWVLDRQAPVGDFRFGPRLLARAPLEPDSDMAGCPGPRAEPARPWSRFAPLSRSALTNDAAIAALGANSNDPAATLAAGHAQFHFGQQCLALGVVEGIPLSGELGELLIGLLGIGPGQRTFA